MRRLNKIKFLILSFLFLLLSFDIEADEAVFEVTIKNHKFEPEIVNVPAEKKIKLIVKNEDNSAEEFESFELKREKIIPGNSQVTINLGPLKKGEYKFFGEFNPNTAQGIMKVGE